MGMYQPYQLLAGLLNVLDINWIWTIALSGEMQLGQLYGRRRRRFLSISECVCVCVRRPHRRFDVSMLVFSFDSIFSFFLIG